MVEEHEAADVERVHYHAVVRQDKQVRMVYDASAKSEGSSLNEWMPKFNQRIFEILLRFRIHHVVLIADIEKAFLMISIVPRNRVPLG